MAEGDFEFDPDAKEGVGFSEFVMNKARKLFNGDRVTSDERPGIWWVQGSAERPYRVQQGNGWTTCTCKHGMTQGRGDPYCAHVAAVLMSEGQLS